MDILRRFAGLLGRKKPRQAEQHLVRPITHEAQSHEAFQQTAGETSEARLSPAADRQELRQAEPREKTSEALLIAEAYPEASDIVRQICIEVLAARPRRYDPMDLATSPRWTTLKSEAPELQVAVAWAALRGERDRNSPYYWKSLEHGEPRRAIFQSALRRNLPFKPEQLLELLQDWLKHDLAFDRDYSGRLLVGAVERLAKRQSLPAEILSALRTILGVIRGNPYQYDTSVTNLAERIDRILKPPLDAPLPEQRTLGAGRFEDELRKWLDTLGPEDSEAWLQFFLECEDVGDKNRPSTAWLKTVKHAIERIGEARIGERLFEMLDTVDHYYSDITKGLMWSTTLMDHSTVAGHVGRFAETWHMSKAGNAALWSLSEMADEPRAAAELIRLREKIKQHATRKLIDRRLAELAEKTNTTIAALEDFSLPSFNLDQESRLAMTFGDARVELTAVATGVVQQWINADGKSVKGVPAEVRDKFAGELATYRQQVKDIESARQVQALSLEGSWAEERSWLFSDWEEHFLRHPLRRPIVQALIWRIGDRAVMPDAGNLKDAMGRGWSFGAQDQVRLWHPLHSEPQEVLAWRARVLERRLTQPIKQAHREIYVLTDAERATRVYSNRFAAHILRQHQLKALCQARGWRYSLQGDWDGWNIPTHALPKQRMSVEYHVEILEEGGRAESSIALHLASDQVRFLDENGQPVPLESISPIVFSEVMRDVDLFVGVTSVANDPNWTDGGPNGQHDGYWQKWAFGELGQTAAMRRELASWLVPKLSIAGQLEVTDKFLIVQGKRQKYAIHFGSSNIQILPSNRYLCIVPDRAPRETRDIKLPFEGDSLLSTILAKAFLLADESKIKDETILRQL
jgi:hypothetical protein